jgi:hypothetical protein
MLGPGKLHCSTNQTTVSVYATVWSESPETCQLRHDLQYIVIIAAYELDAPRRVTARYNLSHSAIVHRYYR